MKSLAIFFFSSALVFSQGEHIYNGNFGFGVNYSYSGNEVFTGSGLSVGISIWGKLDLGFEYATGKTNIKYYESDLQSVSTMFHIGYNAKLKTRGNLKIVLGYLNATSDMIFASGIEAKGFALGLLFNYKILDTEKFIIMPGMGIIYGFVSATSDTKGHQSTIESRNLGLEINLVLPIANSLKIILTPSLSVDLIGEEKTSTPGISVGLLFNSIKSE